MARLKQGFYASSGAQAGTCIPMNVAMLNNFNASFQTLNLILVFNPFASWLSLWKIEHILTLTEAPLCVEVILGTRTRLVSCKLDE